MYLRDRADSEGKCWPTVAVIPIGRIDKSVYNMSITEYIQRKRISVAEHMLIQTDLTIAEISRIVGYSNPSRLIEIFKRYYGFTPSKYRK